MKLPNLIDAIFQARSWESPEQGRGILVGFFKSSMSDPEKHASGWRPRLPDPQPRASFASSPVSTRPNVVAAEGILSKEHMVVSYLLAL